MPYSNLPQCKIKMSQNLNSLRTSYFTLPKDNLAKLNRRSYQTNKVNQITESDKY